jgi:hypothetical protein
MIWRYYTEESIGVWDNWVTAVIHLVNGPEILYQLIRFIGVPNWQESGIKRGHALITP